LRAGETGGGVVTHIAAGGTNCAETVVVEVVAGPAGEVHTGADAVVRASAAGCAGGSEQVVAGVAVETASTGALVATCRAEGAGSAEQVVAGIAASADCGAVARATTCGAALTLAADQRVGVFAVHTGVGVAAVVAAAGTRTAAVAVEVVPAVAL
jgi:hypothetical protein